MKPAVNSLRTGTASFTLLLCLMCGERAHLTILGSKATFVCKQQTLISAAAVNKRGDAVVVSTYRVLRPRYVV